MAEDLNNSFLDVFQGLSDPRSTRNRLYSMSEILLTTLCAVICGAEGWKDIEDFGKTKVDYLRQYFPFKNGSPSDDTFRRFFRALDTFKMKSWVATSGVILRQVAESILLIWIQATWRRVTYKI